MPVYDYQCDHCQTRFEVRASFQEKELGLKPMCPNCKSADTRQLLSAGLFVRSGNNVVGSLPSSCCNPNSGSGCCGG